jgi:Glycine zipper
MKTKLLVAGLFAAAALPALAIAQPYGQPAYDPGCVQDNHQNNVAGTVIGGITGAIIGGAIGSNNHNTGAGVAIGAATGAVAGNTIARSNDHPCPAGYVYQGPPPPQYQGPPQANPGDFWYGAPTGINQRIDFMQSRIDTSSARGWVSGRQSYQLNAQLNDIRQQNQNMRYRDGGHLSPQDRDYLQGLLDNLSQRLHWMAHN